MNALTASPEVLEKLPAMLQIAQEAIYHPEVQEILKTLAKYNLGICMPHMHKDDEDFAVLPEHLIQVERDCEVTFEIRDGLSASKAVPVAWRWQGDEVNGCAVCATTCVPTHLQSGGEGHKSVHNQV